MKLYLKKSLWILMIVNIPFIISFWLTPNHFFELSTSSAATVHLTVQFVDENQQPLANQTIRILCYDDTSSGTPLLDIITTTDLTGAPTHTLPNNCQSIAALQLRHEQPGKSNLHPAYQLFYTNWVPGTSAPPIIPANGEIEISSANQLVLFHVGVSLEWEPAADDLFTEELYKGLSAASQLLYDLSEGRMAIGPISIYTGGEQWEQADLRFRAANDYRPSAYVGGIVSQPTKYDIVNTTKDPIYAPGAIYLGRYWDGQDAFNPKTGSWNQPAAYRTLVHEWAHYALFLYDEYQQQNGAAAYCVCANLPNSDCGHGDLAGSLMAYHYTADELWFTPLHGNPASCLDTDQYHVHGQSDWRTLTVWPQIQGLSTTLDAPSELTTGPLLGITADLFGQTPAYNLYLPLLQSEGDPPPPAKGTADIVAQLAVDEMVPADSKLPARVYVVENNAEETPSRIIYHGTPIGGTQPSGALGEIDLLGVTSADEVRAFVMRYTRNGDPSSGKGYIYPEAGQAAAGLAADVALTVAASDWLASVDLTYELSGTLFTTMTAHLTSAEPINVPIEIQLCAVDAAVGCDGQWAQTMTAQGGNRWTASFNPLSGEDELPLYAIVHIKARGFEERIVHYQAAGGVGPAHVDAYAPLRDGQATVSTDLNLKGDGECNRVFIATADNFTSQIMPLGQAFDSSNNLVDVAGIISWPIDIDVVIPSGSLVCDSSAPEDHELQVPMLLTYFYSPEALAELGISPSQLRLMHFERTPSPTFGIWSPLTTLGSSDDLNWLAADITEDGIYAIGWVP